MKVIRFVALAVLASVAGCAASLNDHMSNEPFRTYQSDKTPDQINTCLSREFAAAQSIKEADGYTVVIRNPQYIIIMTWSLRSTSSGTAIEVRRTNTFAPGIKQAESCY